MEVTHQVEQDSQAIGRQIYAHPAMARPSSASREGWGARILEWSMRDEELKVGLFRFIDVLPQLTTREQIVEHLVEYLSPHEQFLPRGLLWGLRAASRRGLAGWALACAVRR